MCPLFQFPTVNMAVALGTGCIQAVHASVQWHTLAPRLTGQMKDVKLIIESSFVPYYANEELNNLYSSPNNIEIFKPKRMREVEQISMAAMI